jgi:competence protein ComEC
VGQGDGLVLADGPHTGIVVDTGPDPGKEDRCLTDLGVTHVKLLVLTHFHADHIDGVPGVLKHRTVDEIETTVLDDPPEGSRKVAAWAEASGVRVSRAALGERRAYGPVAWDVLWPDPLLLDTATAGNNANAPPPTAKRSRSKRSRSSRRSGSKSEEGSAPNNASIVLRVRVATADGPVTLLLTGDIEPPAQEALLARYPDLTADVLKIPHHGSAHQDPDLVARVRPRAAVISVGRGNTYGHPAPRTLALAASGGARVLRTDNEGNVPVVGPASRLRVVLRR